MNGCGGSWYENFLKNTAGSRPTIRSTSCRPSNNPSETNVGMPYSPPWPSTCAPSTISRRRCGPGHGCYSARGSPLNWPSNGPKRWSERRPRSASTVSTFPLDLVALSTPLLGLFAIDIPAERAYPSVRDRLLGSQAAGDIEFEEAALSVAHDYLKR